MSDGQSLPKTTARLVKCPKREIKRSPVNVLCHGLVNALPWYLKGLGGKLPHLSSFSASITACPSSLHTSTQMLLCSPARKRQSLPQSCAKWNHHCPCSAVRPEIAATSKSPFQGVSSTFSLLPAPGVC